MRGYCRLGKDVKVSIACCPISAMSDRDENRQIGFWV